jgi:signal transduction histidine kinase
VSPSLEQPDALVRDAVDAARPLAAAKRIALAALVPPDLPPVVADRERILQVFSNLLGNAVKFTAEGGRVEVRATRRDGEGGGGVVEFTVSDTGPGIAPEDLPHVFERFWRAKKVARTGTGLGLAITKAIVEAHGGQVRAESEPGRGSRFSFTLRAG